MGPGEHRPHDEEYWQRPWARALFAGDLFEAIPTVLYTPDQGAASGKHFLGEIAFGYGLLITPTCDMTEQHGERTAAHPFRPLVPVVPLELVVKQTGAIERGLGLLRSRDAITPYMYLPKAPERGTHLGAKGVCRSPRLRTRPKHPQRAGEVHHGSLPLSVP